MSEMHPVALATMLLPYVLRLAFSIALVAVTSRGAGEVGSRGWRLLNAAALIQLVEHLLRAYPTYLMYQVGSMRHNALTLGLWNSVSTLVAPVIYALLVLGLLELFNEHRALRGKAAPKA